MDRDTCEPLFGIDISNNNGNVDLAQVRREGFDFVFAKVSEGAGFRDALWPGFRDQAQQCGLILAGYHYIRADADPAAQARAFVEHLGDPSIPAMLDFELRSGEMGLFWAVLGEVEALGVKVALSYIPRWYWEQIGSPDLSEVPGLFSSRYVEGGGYAWVLYERVPAEWWDGFGGAAPAILQFTDQASVAGRLLDASAFRGTRADLANLLGIPEPLFAPLPAPGSSWKGSQVVVPGLGHQGVPDAAIELTERSRAGTLRGKRHYRQHSSASS